MALKQIHLLYFTIYFSTFSPIPSTKADISHIYSFACSFLCRFLLSFCSFCSSQKAVVSEQSKTFSLLEEDHTLGNALRHIVMQDPNTEFCGYTVPHPSEPILHIRVQTKENTTSDKVMMAGAKTLKSMCDHIMTTYKESLATKSS
jgi:DNA-directed RNA polymerases I and III subunit RPAC2